MQLGVDKQLDAGLHDGDKNIILSLLSLDYHFISSNHETLLFTFWFILTLSD